MANQSSAYDFELFEPKRRNTPEPRKKSNVIEIPREKLEQNRRPKIRLAKILPAFLAFLTISGMVGAYVNGQVQLSELSGALGTAEQSLREGQDVYSQLKIQSDAKFSREAVETYASQKLGMKQTDPSQVVSVGLSKGDKAQVVTKDTGKSWLERAWEAIRSRLS
ncbi:MAG: hypothetical protein LKJ21_02300 [Oscillospiraceae bacterium]|jgi:cell division protein FtsL|nr:hypothetical protein [Oscillospiraceae bacterium]MCI2035637.1 hypothetical protein [Oscillospiraceae bacterium]